MATAGNDGSESSSAGESTGTGEAMLSGTVTDLNAFFSGTTDVIEGAQISIFGLDAITATSGADGTFEIGPVPVGADYSFVVAPSTDYWGAIITMTIEDGSEAIELAQPPRELIEMFVVTLEEQGAEPVDETLAALAGRVISTSAVAEGSVTLDLDPAPDMNTYFTADTGGSMVLNSQEIVWDVIPVVAYYNLPESDPGTMELGATHPTRQCMPVHPAFPTLAEHITLVDIRCPPAG
jgi:hypothetical protein